MIGSSQLARRLNIRPSRLIELLHDRHPQDERPGKGGRWEWTEEQADRLVWELLPLIPKEWIIEYPRLLSDEEIKELAGQFGEGNPVEFPRGADLSDALKRLRRQGLEEVHVAEETEEDGIVLMA